MCCAEQEITGDVLLTLDAALLKSEIGIMAFGKRVRIANAVAELRRPPSPAPPPAQSPASLLHPHALTPAYSHSRNTSYGHGYAHSVQSSAHVSLNSPRSWGPGPGMEGAAPGGDRRSEGSSGDEQQAGGGSGGALVGLGVSGLGPWTGGKGTVSHFPITVGVRLGTDHGLVPEGPAGAACALTERQRSARKRQRHSGRGHPGGSRGSRCNQ